MARQDEVTRHAAEIERLNQRGGRMLSIVDLLEAGTLTTELAAYLLAAIEGGASFMTAALPGGAGKTTVMGALLNFVPAGRELVPADGPETVAAGLAWSGPRRCYICHEIGAGRYYAYLWNGVLRAYFELGRAGHQLATNLHADSIAGARKQVCDDNGVPEADFNRMYLILFITWNGRKRRDVAELWESDGVSAHQQVFAVGRLDRHAIRLADERSVTEAGERLAALLRSGARTIAEVRRFLTEGNPLP